MEEGFSTDGTAAAADAEGEEGPVALLDPPLVLVVSSPVVLVCELSVLHQFLVSSNSNSQCPTRSQNSCVNINIKYGGSCLHA